MEKRRINAAMILAAGGDAHLQSKADVPREKSIDGETFMEIAVDSICNNPMQPRIFVSGEELKDLCRSIKLHGLIQPIAAIKIGDDKYMLKVGQRRLLAHKELGLQTIKAIVQEETFLPWKESQKSLFEIGITENAQRENLNPLELALSIKNALDSGFYRSNYEIATALGKSKSYITKIMKVLKLNEEIIKDLSNNKSTSDLETLYNIQKIKNAQEQVKVYNDFIAKKIDSKGIQILTKKKNVSCTKLYTISLGEKSARINLNFQNVDDEQRVYMMAEIEELLKKYEIDQEA